MWRRSWKRKSSISASAHGLVPGLPGEGRLALGVGEDVAADVRPSGHPAQERPRLAREADRTPVPVLGLLEPGHAGAEVDVLPAERQELAQAGAGGEGEEDQRIEPRLVAGAAGLEEPLALLVGEHPHAAAVLGPAPHAAGGIPLEPLPLLLRQGQDRGEAGEVAVGGRTGDAAQERGARLGDRRRRDPRQRHRSEALAPPEQDAPAACRRLDGASSERFSAR